MLQHVTAPTREFTRIRNAQIWDDEISDSAFRLLVRAASLAPAKARTTTVTDLTAGLSVGRIAGDRARKCLTRAGLLHSLRWRSPEGRLRTESLLSDVPLTEDEGRRLLTEHFERLEGGGGSDDAPPDAGEQQPGEPADRSPGTALPKEERLGEANTPPSRSHVDLAPPLTPLPERAEAERVLRSLRQVDPRLHLGAAEVARLAPLAAEWLARGVGSEAMRYALTAGLPRALKSAAGFLRYRLLAKAPVDLFGPAAGAGAVAPLLDCERCERPFRSLVGEERCGACRRAAPVRSAEAPRGVVGWRERVAQLGGAG
ncbi:hypothetical protein [Kitasatospora sp. LaBMicrA B282]|uniref:hypothetical protein n=1 Tax=Kitasatospora sp. LaBMicrA B282 TaxID=3420949 RepID=UPI003D0C77D7